MLKKIKTVFKQNSLRSLLPSRVVRDHRFRFCRVKSIKQKANSLARILDKFDFRQTLTVDKTGRICVLDDGIALNISSTDRFLKITGKNIGNEGRNILNFLRDRGIDNINSFVDIGANIGEISLYFAQKFPKARIIAVEPHPRNLGFLREHLSNQHFCTSNITLVEYGISNKTGVAQLSNRHAQSSIVDHAGRNTIEIRIFSLDALWVDMGLKDVDFVKIDIEGAEPLLIDKIRDMAHLVSAWLIEFSPKSAKDNYLPFFELFMSRGFHVFARSSGRQLTSLNEACNYFCSIKSSEDFWFVQQNRTTGSNIQLT